jgi:hypothetical protein
MEYESKITLNFSSNEVFSWTLSVISHHCLIVKYFYFHKTSSQEFHKLSFVASNNVFF